MICIILVLKSERLKLQRFCNKFYEMWHKSDYTDSNTFRQMTQGAEELFVMGSEVKILQPIGRVASVTL